MTPLQILVFSLAALLAGLARSWRQPSTVGADGPRPAAPSTPGLHRWIILVFSAIAVYWLQPGTPIYHLDFWLPTLSLCLCVLAWVATRPPGAGAPDRESVLAGLLMAGVIAGVSLLRYIEPLCCLIPTTPPALLPQVLSGLVAAALLAAAAWRINRSSPQRAALLVSTLIVLVLGLFILLKSEALAQLASAVLRQWNGQSPALAKATDLRWLGFSYMAFRILQTLRDRQAGRLASLTLLEYASGVLFFPALSAGPIDRVDRLAKDLNQFPFRDRQTAWVEGSQRIVLGLFKKFAVADTLALVALNQANAAQVQSAGWAWLLLYAYALRIYFDFSGCTDIALGLGRLAGIKLPENFDRPYLKPNLTAFWNAWHMSLAQWFRSYYFNPLTRWLRSRKIKLPQAAIIFAGQFTTMVLIGIWHGLTWNFLIWGIWHGLGLFLHNRWLDFRRARQARDAAAQPEKPQPAAPRREWTWLGTFLTFNYVALGWIWFALPLPAQSWAVLLKLFGG